MKMKINQNNKKNKKIKKSKKWKSYIIKKMEKIKQTHLWKKDYSKFIRIKGLAKWRLAETGVS